MAMIDFLETTSTVLGTELLSFTTNSELFPIANIAPFFIANITLLIFQVNRRVNAADRIRICTKELLDIITKKNNSHKDSRGFKGSQVNDIFIHRSKTLISQISTFYCRYKIANIAAWLAVGSAVFLFLVFLFFFFAFLFTVLEQQKYAIILVAVWLLFIWFSLIFTTIQFLKAKETIYSEVKFATEEYAKFCDFNNIQFAVEEYKGLNTLKK